MSLQSVAHMLRSWFYESPRLRICCCGTAMLPSAMSLSVLMRINFISVSVRSDVSYFISLVKKTIFCRIYSTLLPNFVFKHFTLKGLTQGASTVSCYRWAFGNFGVGSPLCRTKDFIIQLMTPHDATTSLFFVRCQWYCFFNFNMLFTFLRRRSGEQWQASTQRPFVLINHQYTIYQDSFFHQLMKMSSMKIQSWTHSHPIVCDAFLLS